MLACLVVRHCLTSGCVLLLRMHWFLYFLATSVSTWQLTVDSRFLRFSDSCNKRSISVKDHCNKVTLQPKISLCLSMLLVSRTLWRMWLHLIDKIGEGDDRLHWLLIDLWRPTSVQQGRTLITSYFQKCKMVDRTISYGRSYGWKDLVRWHFPNCM